MSIFMLPYISYKNIELKPIFSKTERSPTIISNSLDRYLSIIKMKIEEYPSEWDIYKKYTNPYECIHSSINSIKPVCNYKPISRSYFKMIEILDSFNILEKYNDKEINSFHLAEGPGGFIEALVNRRNNENDSYIGMTLISDDKNVPGWKKSKMFLNKNKNVSLEEGEDGTGNIMKVDNLLYCSNKYGNKMDIITADGGFDFSVDFNGQESLITGLLISQIAFASALQKPGGTFILKVFDIFNKASVHIVFILCMMYESVSIIKPHTSRYANSERYIVCQNYRILNNDEWINKFSKILDELKDSNNNIISLLDENVIPNIFMNKLEECNIIIGQQQLENISNTLNLIKNPNSDKLEFIRKNNINKCIHWCQKHKMPYNRDVKQQNIFLNTKLNNKRDIIVDDEIVNSDIIDF